MYRSPRFAFASLALVLAFGLAHAQTRSPEKLPAPMVCPAPSNGGPGVAVEVRVFRVGDALFAELMKDHRLSCKNLVTVGDNAAKEMIARILEDSDSENLAAPRICTLSGQEGRITIGQESPFVTDVKAGLFPDPEVFVPQIQTFFSGCNIIVLPTITPDNKHVVIRFQAEQSELPDNKVPLFPVTTMITPVFEGGAQGQPLPFTQFLQQPTMFKRSVTNAFGLADGQTALVYGGHTSRTDKQVERVPFFSDLPIIGDLFETETEKQVSNHLVYMVTPQIVVAPRAAAPCQAACCPVPPLSAMPAPAMPCQATWCPVMPPPPHAMLAIAWQQPCYPPMPLPSAMPMTAPRAPVQAAARFVAVSPAAATAVEPTCMPPCRLPEPVQPAMCPPIPMKAPCKLPEEVKTNDTPHMVSLRCSIIKIDEAFFSRPEGEAWADLSPKATEATGKFIDDDTAQRFVCALRAQKAGFLTAQPILTTCEGQEACFRCGGEGNCVTGVAFVNRNGTTIPDFNALKVSYGIECKFLPLLNADKSCQLSWSVTERRADDEQPAPCEVTVRIPATDETPESVHTETIQALNISQNNFVAKQDIPRGKCVLMYYGTDKTDHGVQHLAILVTPSECVSIAEKVARAAAIASPTPAQAMVAPPMMKVRPCDGNDNCVYPYPVVALEERLARYRKACADERWGDARKLAVECLELDPKCFLQK